MNLSLAQIRERYQAAAEDPLEAESLWRKLDHYRGEDAIILGYKAATRVLLANFSLFPLTKLAYLKEAMQLFRQAVRQDPGNIEVRFLRYSIQHHLPTFLNESRDMPEDKAVLMERIAEYRAYQLSQDQLATFFDFFESCGHFSPSELDQLRQAIA